MIKINSVHGLAIIDDKKGLRSIAPEKGLTLSEVGADLLVVTGEDGIVELTINNRYVLLERNSYLHIRPDGRSFLRKHKEKLFGKNTTRMVIGKIWAQIVSTVGNEQGEEIRQGNAAVGVRG